ncbi:AI-2E family transporter [Sulfuriferula thiophila]|uniref:AI-2E family transporter n=1 Tax=Sulfuriferula thiophila TaxID=1781211 RepID=UPI000F614787|nr:AI-2E family transporter [Sulfuriferula thiophila]
MNPNSDQDADIQRVAVPAADATEGVHTFVVHVPVDARGLALGILAAVAVIFALDWMQTFFVPLLLGIFLTYTLNPLVILLERIKIPRILGTSVVIVAFICAFALGTYSLRGQMQTIFTQLPEAASKLSAGLANMRNDPDGSMQRMQAAVGEMEQAGSQITSTPPGHKQRITHIVIDKPGFKLGDVMWAGSVSVLGFISQATMVIFLAFFLLAGGDTFKRKLLRLTGPSLSRKKITINILNDINNSIQKYMFMLLLTNMLLGLLSWVAFRLIGLDNAGGWAVTAGLLHTIPYIGPVFTAAATGMVAYLQFDSMSMALLVAGASLAIATFVGTFVTTWVTGRIAKMNAAAVFISLLFWAWLWGIWGMLLGIPIIVIIKVISQHVEQLQPVAEVLGE